MVVHGGARQNLLDFSVSINPYLPEWSKELFSKLPAASRKYSYIEWLEDSFRARYGNRSVILSGITEALQILSYTLMDNSTVVVPVPCYGEYERISGFKAKKIIKIAPKDGEIDIKRAFEKAKNLQKNGDKTVLIFANPNNPTGSYFRGIAGEIKELTDIGVVVIIDEAFIDFVKEPEDLLDTGALLMRSFTKSYGMPGIRIGYTIGYEKLFRHYRMPWATGASGYLFVECLLSDNGKFLAQSKPRIWNEKTKFREIGMKTDCNFGCINVANADRAEERLKKFGIYVRNCSSFGFPDKIRVSIRTPKENDMLINAIKKVIL